MTSAKNLDGLTGLERVRVISKKLKSHCIKYRFKKKERKEKKQDKTVLQVRITADEEDPWFSRTIYSASHLDISGMVTLHPTRLEEH